MTDIAIEALTREIERYSGKFRPKGRACGHRPFGRSPTLPLIARTGSLWWPVPITV